MIKLIVVAGSSSQKLAEFFSKRGTFEIVSVYENLTDNVNQIQNRVTISDKLLYLYNDHEESVNVKSDMQILGNLLKHDSFFKPGEIVFMTTSSQQAKQAIKFFVTIMEDCCKKDYSIKTVEDKMSFIAIYNQLMGTSHSSDFKNKYLTLYKVERNVEADLEYPPQDDRNLLVEPFTYDQVTTYGEKQRAAKKVDTGTIYTDSQDYALPKDNSMQFDAIEVNSLNHNTHYVIISGMPKSGKSVWATQLAVSAAKQELSVCLLDFTMKADILHLISQSSVKVEEQSLLSALRMEQSTNGITYIAPHNPTEATVTREFVQLMINQNKSVFGIVMLACEISELRDMQRLFPIGLHTLVTSNATIDDINITCEYLDLYSQSADNTLILNQCLVTDETYVSATDARELLPKEIRIVKDMHFNNYDAKGSLYTAMFGN